MAYFSSNRAETLSLGERLTEIRQAAAIAYSNWRVYRRTLNELRELSTRELADLGINPSMIHSIAMEAAYGKAA